MAIDKDKLNELLKKAKIDPEVAAVLREINDSDDETPADKPRRQRKGGHGSSIKETPDLGNGLTV